MAFSYLSMQPVCLPVTCFINHLSSAFIHLPMHTHIHISHTCTQTHAPQTHNIRTSDFCIHPHTHPHTTHTCPMHHTHTHHHHTHHTHTTTLTHTHAPCTTHTHTCTHAHTHTHTHTNTHTHTHHTLTSPALRHAAVHSFKSEIATLQNQVHQVSLERDKLRMNLSRTLEENRKLVREGDEHVDLVTQRTEDQIKYVCHFVCPSISDFGTPTYVHPRCPILYR